ncbi:MAG: class I SAM-dependent methyltransferase [Leptolyngbyaceae cyanobacterium bins.349]|nr:class I SAM-dependent methyltransferase [Leptolyngbyaceae cyanobacterium bins.349]
MAGLRIQDVIKKRIATLGARPSYRLETIYYLLLFGDWLKQHSCDRTFDNGYALYQHLNEVVLQNQPIDFLEFGVYNGYSLKIWLDLNQNQQSRFFGFDSFEGLPEDWKMFSRTLPKGTFDLGGQPPEIEDSRVQLVKGIFQQALPSFLENFRPQNRLFIHCDADLYTSTLYVLTTLNSLMVPGTILLFDEFSSVTHEFRAFNDFTQSFMRNYRIVATCEPFYAQVAIELL